MLRCLIGLILLVVVVASPLRASAADEHPADDERSRQNLQNLIESFEQFLGIRQPTEEEKERLRLELENRQRLEQNALTLKHMLVEKRAPLAQVGPTFEITAIGSGFSGSQLLGACLIGETGTVYMYDVSRDAAAQATSVVNEREFSQAASLAKSIGHVEWQPRHILDDYGFIVWTISFDGKTTALQIAGDYLGALPDPRVGELVKSIDGWCRYSQELRSRLSSPDFDVRPPY